MVINDFEMEKLSICSKWLWGQRSITCYKINFGSYQLLLGRGKKTSPWGNISDAASSVDIEVGDRFVANIIIMIDYVN